MGKKGAAMRAAKQDHTVYTFTKEQLAAHDKFVIDQRIEKIKQKLEEEKEQKNTEIQDMLEREWKRREELCKFDNGGFNDLLSLMLCIPARVLIEKFHWKPIPTDAPTNKKLQIVRFADAVAEEINAIQSDELKDLRRYSEETYEKYGVKFVSNVTAGQLPTT